ncbi:MAG: methyltransferase domain-containing protein [Nannocystaceae bacterium]
MGTSGRAKLRVGRVVHIAGGKCAMTALGPERYRVASSGGARVETSSNQQKHEGGNPVVRWLVDRFHARVVAAVRSVSPRSILDIGCGEGYTLGALVDAEIASDLRGVDLSDRAVSAARIRLGAAAEVWQGDIRRLAGQGQKHDLVLMLEVLEHLADPASILPILAELSGGHVILSVPWEPFFRGGNLLRGQYLRRWGNHPEHVNLWGRRAFLDFISPHFEVLHTPNAFPWTLVLARVR